MNPPSSSQSPYTKDVSANTAVSHREFLVCSYENNAAKEEKQNPSQLVMRIVLDPNNKGIASSYNMLSRYFHVFKRNSFNKQ